MFEFKGGYRMLNSRTAASRILLYGKSRVLGFMIAGVAIAVFATGGVESLSAHRGFAGSAAWAEPPDGSPDAEDAASKQEAPDISGSYYGTLSDHNSGANSLSADITQTGMKVSGTWISADYGGIAGTLKGEVKANGEVKMQLKIKRGNAAGCFFTVDGTFENLDEISAVYHLDDCTRPDHGILDMTEMTEPPPLNCVEEGGECDYPRDRYLQRHCCSGLVCEFGGSIEQAHCAEE
jgi:hypothetical protein